MILGFLDIGRSRSTRSKLEILLVDMLYLKFN